MVRLVVEAPLAKDDAGARVLHSRYHVCEVFLLHLLEALIVGGALDLEAVLSLGLGRLEWARQNAHPRVVGHLRHLGVRELLINDDALNEA